MPQTSAVGAKSYRPNGSKSIETRLSSVESDVATLKQTLTDNREAAAKENQATHELLQQVIDGLGRPANGPSQPASGVYWAIEGVSSRLKPFEQRWEQVKGGLTTLGAISLPVGALVWFLSGSRITALFHG